MQATDPGCARQWPRHTDRDARARPRRRDAPAPPGRLALESLFPTHGPLAGGACPTACLNLVGAGFTLSDLAITIGGNPVPASSVHIASDEQLSLYFPAGARSPAPSTWWSPPPPPSRPIASPPATPSIPSSTCRCSALSAIAPASAGQRRTGRLDHARRHRLRAEPRRAARGPHRRARRHWRRRLQRRRLADRGRARGRRRPRRRGGDCHRRRRLPAERAPPRRLHLHLAAVAAPARQRRARAARRSPSSAPASCPVSPPRSAAPRPPTSRCSPRRRPPARCRPAPPASST